MGVRGVSLFVCVNEPVRWGVKPPSEGPNQGQEEADVRTQV